MEKLKLENIVITEPHIKEFYIGSELYLIYYNYCGLNYNRVFTEIMITKKLDLAHYVLSVKSDGTYEVIKNRCEDNRCIRNVELFLNRENILNEI